MIRAVKLFVEITDSNECKVFADMDGWAYVTITCRIDSISSSQNYSRMFNEAFVTTKTLAKRDDLQHQCSLVDDERKPKIDEH